MCGIVGYVGNRPALGIVLDGLRRLEYRGYDSAGVAIIDAHGHLLTERRASWPTWIGSPARLRTLRTLPGRPPGWPRRCGGCAVVSMAHSPCLRSTRGHPARWSAPGATPRSWSAEVPTRTISPATCPRSS